MTELLCVEIFHVYPGTNAEARVRGQISSTAAALFGLISGTDRHWRPLVVIDDYFAFDRWRGSGDGVPASAEPCEPELALMGTIAAAWADCWTLVRDGAARRLAGAPPPLTFVRESAFEPLAWLLAEMLEPRLATGPAREGIDGSLWRRPPWTAGPVGAWLANDRPPRSAPLRNGPGQMTHATLNPQHADRHSIHLDIELFDCDSCRAGGRCDGFGRCDATATRRMDLRMSCPILAAALHVGRGGGDSSYAHEAIPTLELRDGVPCEAGPLTPASELVSVLDVQFIDVEHAVAVILDHLPHPTRRPTYMFVSEMGA